MFQGRSKKSLNDSFLGEEYEEYSIFKYVDLAWMRMDLLYFSLLDRGGSNLMPRDDATTRGPSKSTLQKRKRKSERDRDRESKRLKTDRRMLSIEPQENSNTKFLFESSIKASNHQASVKRFNNTHYHSSSFR